MKRRILLAAATCLAVVAGVACASGADFGALASLLFAHAPRVPFDAATAPPAPDYAQQGAWGALPGIPNATDAVPSGVTRADPANAPADVFFIHPTTYFSNQNWNQPLSDSETNARTDSGTLRAQASAFNGCCLVYAPRYRQMTLGGFLEHSKSSDEALALAYSDVKRAFDYYIAHYNRGRPFIVASHSQGSRLAVMLLAREIDATPLRKHFVAAYIAGNWIAESWFAQLKTIKPCERADDIGCALTWSTLAEDANAQSQREAFAKRSGLPAAFANEKFVCTNPLSWSQGETIAPASLNEGAWIPGRGATFRPVDPGEVSARCDDGALFVSQPADFSYRLAKLPGGNYHNYDYQLFYMNIRTNAQKRVAAFLAGR